MLASKKFLSKKQAILLAEQKGFHDPKGREGGNYNFCTKDLVTHD